MEVHHVILGVEFAGRQMEDWIGGLRELIFLNMLQILLIVLIENCEN